ncbi:MAG: hypothetical protein QNK37_04425 [Acidobacteriota bacterium]|nr:hypothetical protein [Acidobacteriota bacterium]
MQIDRHKLITEIVEAAIQLPPERRTCFVRGACNDDDDLQSEVVRQISVT